MNIMILDDHELFSEGLKLLLEGLRIDLTISQATTTSQALKFENKESFRLILLDYNLKGTSGSEAIRLIRQTFSNSMVVVISSEEGPGLIKESIDLGASGFIPKSSSKDVLDN